MLKLTSGLSCIQESSNAGFMVFHLQDAFKFTEQSYVRGGLVCFHHRLSEQPLQQSLKTVAVIPRKSNYLVKMITTDRTIKELHNAIFPDMRLANRMLPHCADSSVVESDTVTNFNDNVKMMMSSSGSWMRWLGIVSVTNGRKSLQRFLQISCSKRNWFRSSKKMPVSRNLQSRIATTQKTFPR